MPYKNTEDRRAHGKRYLIANREKIYQRIAEYRKKNWAILKEYKRGLVCIDCGYSNKDFPETLDFDHVRGKKEHGICGMFAYTNSLKRVMKEIEKCEVVCSNCHRIRTMKRLKSNPHPAAEYWKKKKQESKQAKRLSKT